MLGELTYYTCVLSIVGDILKIRPRHVGLGDLAVVENWNGDRSLAQVIEIQREEVSLQVFTGGKGSVDRCPCPIHGASVASLLFPEYTRPRV